VLELGVPVDLGLIEQVLDHVPEIAFFLKDRHGRYLAVNQSLVDRCGFREKYELLGRRAREIFPKQLGELYDAQDESVLRTAKPIFDRLELHWYTGRRPGWCLTTKLPVRDRSGAVIGLVGISRDLRAHEDAEAIPPGFARAVEFLESHCDEALSPGALARRAGLPPVRFARLTKRIFRLTPNQLILQKRLNAAARLLIETDRSMADIACACGFYDHSAMTRAFRSATNMTPSQFRSSKRAAATPAPLDD
jgi:PAS domain S-box-containing protein